MNARAWLKALSLAIWPLVSTLGAEAAPEPAASAARTVIGDLEYTESPDTVMRTWEYYRPNLPPFKKEPDTGRHKVFRTTLSSGKDASAHTGLLWHSTARKLYVDLNRNQDLTDDPVWSAEPRREKQPQGFPGNEQIFQGIKFAIPTADGPRPLAADLRVWTYQGQAGFILLQHSYWQGRLTLQGQEWQFGLIEQPNQHAGLTPSALLLRPWEHRNRPLEGPQGQADMIPLTTDLCLLGQGYRVRWQYMAAGGAPRYRLELTEKPLETADLRIQGSVVRRIVFSDTRGNVRTVLDAPGPLARMPVGEHRLEALWLQGEKNLAKGLRLPEEPAVRIQAGKTNTLTVGGPLTNTIRATLTGRRLALEYRLVGARGMEYALSNGNGRSPTTWSIYRGDKKLASGTSFSGG